MQRSELQRNLDCARRDFTRQLLELLKLAQYHDPKNLDLYDAFNLVKTVSAVNPSSIIEISGPYLFRYREQIIKKDERFFLEGNFTSEISEINARADLNTSDIKNLLDSLRTTWSKIKPSDHEMIWNHSTMLLRSYATYLGIQKKFKML